MAGRLELAAQVTALTQDILALPDSTIRAPTPPSPTPSPARSAETSPTKSRFSRFRAPFRRISSTASSRYLRARKGSEPLIKPSGPDLSDHQQQQQQTQVPFITPSLGPADLLDLFAPLVSRLQALGLNLREFSDLDQDLVDDFAGCCTELEKRIDLFTQHHSAAAAAAEADPHDVEMKKLLLSALAKKVELERTSTSIPESTGAPSPPLSRSNSSNANPLVLHSSHVLAPPDSRRSSLTPPSKISESRSIPIASAAAPGPGLDGHHHLAPYPSFADAGQHVGLANVFRLGSFQNSLLFSPSPVAVRQPLRSASGLSG